MGETVFMRRRRERFLRFLPVLLTVLPACLSNERDSRVSAAPYVVVAGRRFDVDVARTTPERALGLGGRESLAEGRGMIFLYGSRKKRFFWMKRMKFDIDIVWIAGDRVVGVHHRAQAEPPGRPDARLRRYWAPVPVDRVLEVPAGTCERVGIGKGARVAFHLDG
jgi:uncharacterized membrane protein (UPF0127 family)